MDRTLKLKGLGFTKAEISRYLDRSATPATAPTGLLEEAPPASSQAKDVFHLIKEVFPEAEILGPDDTDWEAIKRCCEEFDAARPWWIEATEQRRKLADEARNHPGVQAWLRHWQGETKYDPECGLTPEQWEEFKRRGIATPLPEPLYRKRKGAGV